MSLPIKKICFIGAGTMGCFNSLLASAAGYECLIYDPFEDALENRSINQAKLANFLKHENFFKGVDVNAAIKKIYDCSDLRLALDYVLDLKEIDFLQKPSIGCNIKWK